MSKSLTLEQLKSLESGDWVWFIDLTQTGHSGEYRQIDRQENAVVFLDGKFYGSRSYDTYGAEWVAYKNKEQVGTPDSSGLSDNDVKEIVAAEKLAALNRVLDIVNSVKYELLSSTNSTYFMDVVNSAFDNAEKCIKEA